MNKPAKMVIVLILIGAVGVVIALKRIKSSPEMEETSSSLSAVETSTQKSNIDREGLQGRPQAADLPRLVDLGADKCIPCKMMAPILEELKKKYAGVFNVEFIDVWKNPDAAEQYGIRVIPTQIFFDASGKELFRHEGFFSKEDILAKWKEHGVGLTKTQ